MPTEVYTALLALLGVLIGFLVDVLKERISVRGDTKNHISQARFDKEFEIYQELSEKNLNMVYGAGAVRVFSELVRYTPFDENDESYKNFTIHRNDFIKNLKEADFSNKKYAPFISKEIFYKYKSLVDKCERIQMLSGFVNSSYSNNGTYPYKNKSYDKASAIDKIISIQEEVSDLSDNILDELREYLKSLDVKEK